MPFEPGWGTLGKFNHSDMLGTGHRMSTNTTVITLLGLKASQELGQLLENKHLYQRVDISPTEILETQRKRENPVDADRLIQWGRTELPTHRFALTQEQLFVASRASAQLPPTLTLALL